MEGDFFFATAATEAWAEPLLWCRE
jgi:hypothetical protein